MPDVYDRDRRNGASIDSWLNERIRPNPRTVFSDYLREPLRQAHDLRRHNLNTLTWVIMRERDSNA